jgi:hypothetical protein
MVEHPAQPAAAAAMLVPAAAEHAMGVPPAMPFAVFSVVVAMSVEHFPSLRAYFDIAE